MRFIKSIVTVVLAVSSIAAFGQESARTVQYHSQDIIAIRAKVKYTTLMKQHGNSPYEFTSSEGTVTLKILQPSAGSVQFRSTCAIKDQNSQTVSYTLANNNETLAFKAVQNNSYSLTLPYICTPSSCYGLLEEDCNGSELSLSLISVNSSVELSIAC